MSRWDQIIEEQLQQAMREGRFRNLPGEGKPLRDDGSDLAGEHWMANHILQENDALPEWLALRKDIAVERPELRRLYEETVERLGKLPMRLWRSDARLKRLMELYVNHARKINLMIDQHNHTCPSIHHELLRVREDAVERAREKLKNERISPHVQRSSDVHGR
jgi:DnaJ homolog subfamily C member 28